MSAIYPGEPADFLGCLTAEGCQDGPGAKAKAKADKRSGEGDGVDGQDPTDPQDGGPAPKPAAGPQGSERAQGGQHGHRGIGLERVAKPDRHEPVEPPECGGCGGDLAGAQGQIDPWMRRPALAGPRAGQVAATFLTHRLHEVSGQAHADVAAAKAISPRAVPLDMSADQKAVTLL